MIECVNITAKIALPTGDKSPVLVCLWRKPDRVLPTRDRNRSQLELDTFDGSSIVMIVDRRNGIKSIQKKNVREEAPSELLVLNLQGFEMARAPRT